MDEHLSAPDPELIWCISPCLDDRNRDHEDLTQLSAKSLMSPKDKGFKSASMAALMDDPVAACIGYGRYFPTNSKTALYTERKIVYLY